MIVLNGILGSFSHSKLFSTVREKVGLAYTISSSFDIFSGLMRIYAGIDKTSRTKTLSLIHRQLTDVKIGKITNTEIKQTKDMIKNLMLLSQDKPFTLLEQSYMKSTFGAKFLELKDWLDKLEKISKDDIVKVAQNIKLQAVYFMEEG